MITWNWQSKKQLNFQKDQGENHDTTTEQKY